MLNEEIKQYCEDEYKNCIRYHSDIEKAIDRCYGAVMFVLNYTERYDDLIGKWWDDEMLPKFRELQYERR